MKKFTTDITKQIAKSSLTRTTLRLAPYTYVKSLSTKPVSSDLPPIPDQLILPLQITTTPSSEPTPANKTENSSQSPTKNNPIYDPAKIEEALKDIKKELEKLKAINDKVDELGKQKQESERKKSNSKLLGIIYSLLMAGGGAAFYQLIQTQAVDWQKGIIIDAIKDLAQSLRDHRDPGNNSKQKVHLLELIEQRLPVPLRIYIGNALSSYYIINDQHKKAKEIALKNIKLVEELLSNKLAKDRSNNNQIKILDKSTNPNVLYNELKQIDLALPTVLAQSLYYLGKTGINEATEESKQQLELAIRLREIIDQDLDREKRDYYNNHIASDTIIFKTLGTITYTIRREDLKEDVAIESLEKMITEVESLMHSLNLRNQKDCQTKKVQLHCLIARKLESSKTKQDLEKRKLHLAEIEKDFLEHYQGKDLNQILQDLEEKASLIEGATTSQKKDVRIARDFNHVGEIALLMGKIEIAKKFYQDAIKIETDNKRTNSFPLSDAYLAMTEICIKEGKPVEAKDYLAKHQEIQIQKGELISNRAKRFEEQIQPKQPQTVTKPNSIVKVYQIVTSYFNARPGN
jgi:hypothetical protein